MENPVWELMSQEVSVDTTPSRFIFYVHYNFLLCFQIKLRKKGILKYMDKLVIWTIQSSKTVQLH